MKLFFSKGVDAPRSAWYVLIMKTRKANLNGENKMTTKIGTITRIQFEDSDGPVAVINRAEKESGTDFNRRYVKTRNEWPNARRCKIMTRFTDGSVQHETLDCR
jgi:hypothetical protein